MTKHPTISFDELLDRWYGPKGSRGRNSYEATIRRIIARWQTVTPAHRTVKRAQDRKRIKRKRLHQK